MTRKDYIAIAAAFKEASRRTYGNSIEQDGVNIAVKMVQDVLSDDNPHFDYKRFQAAIYS